MPATGGCINVAPLGGASEEGRGLAGAPAKWEMACDPHESAVRDARARLHAELRRANVPAPAIANVLLVVGELASNAVRHARTEFTISAAVSPDAVRIEVFDGDTRIPTLVGLDPASTSGRGLHIVAGVARDWGWRFSATDGGASGKWVWAEVPLA